MAGKDLCPQISSYELKRIAVLRRYSNVAFELPEWAQQALSLKMGTIKVTAKDSLELYLIGLENAVPLFDYVTFQKKFAEIFERRAFLVLRQIVENRNNDSSHYISNDYFWQEFRDLFSFKLRRRSKFSDMLCDLEKAIWNCWNRKLRGVLGLNRAIAKVGLSGMQSGRWMLRNKTGEMVHPVKWK